MKRALPSAALEERLMQFVRASDWKDADDAVTRAVEIRCCDAFEILSVGLLGSWGSVAPDSEGNQEKRQH
jgi:hypothetical protein